jgi:hypothetical protein
VWSSRKQMHLKGDLNMKSPFLLYCIENQRTIFTILNDQPIND